eukprot:TRINITY_DN52641_c0_g1_i1.p1 TRINITY_DN52641_c0_g1~~TRINITY_DN52641_c0_g1_i1.p1  ORF type:complete len:610 (+),score=51.86 TRINITY_DN52641_c0_g1_i1:129-1958(+)
MSDGSVSGPIRRCPHFDSPLRKLFASLSRSTFMIFLIGGSWNPGDFLKIRSVEACTTLVAGPQATADGSVMVAHSNDGDGDVAGNFEFVPAKRYHVPSQRALSNGKSIPQIVGRTNAYFTKVGGYAAMNEFQVALGESTCVAVLPGNTSAALLNIVDLSAVGLERAKSAREAVEVMGQLAEQYGYYDNGESLMVTDPTEAFIFHILPDDTQTSAVWVAQRVPDDHVGVVANSFTIRVVDFSDKRSFLASMSMREVARRTRRWVEGTAFDFTRIFAGAEPGHRYASGHRMWVAFQRLAAPLEATKLPLYYAEYVSEAPYPSTLPAGGNVTLTSMKATMRDYYSGTPLDMTKPLAAGPFGTPDRWATSAETLAAFPHASWERTIATPKSILSYVAVLRKWLPREIGGVLWLSFHAAHTAVALPLPVGLMMQEPSQQESAALWPRGLLNNALNEVGRGVSGWQANRFVFNVAQLHFNDMIVDIANEQRKWEETGRGGELLLSLEREMLSDGTRSASCPWKRVVEHCEEAIRAWWSLSDDLLIHYADGYCNGCGSGRPRNLGYPVKWLEAVSFEKGPLTPAPEPPPPVRSSAEDIDFLRVDSRKLQETSILWA